MARRLLAAACTAALLAGCSAGASTPQFAPAPAADVPAAAQAPRRALFPPTVGGVHLNLAFNYDVRNLHSEIGVVDVVWGSRSPKPRQVMNQFYTPFERDNPPYSGGHSLTWFRAHHPDWIEYRCNRTSVAWEFGERSAVPFDIANPAVLAYQRATSVVPAFKAGYRTVDFDNLSLGNYAQRCGHYSASGTWVQQYSGAWDDSRYVDDVLAWARSTYAYVHGYAPTATMAINYSYQTGFGFARNYRLMTSADEDLDERGFTNWGSKGQNVASPQQWSQIVRAIDALHANGSCYVENGEEPELSKDITQAERLWVVSNYLLTRDDCTYVWMSGFTASGAQDYGRVLLYPEYRLPIGSPTGAASKSGAGWTRAYSGGLVVVNPSKRRAVFHFSGTYRDENGTRYSGSIALGAGTGQVLLRR